MVPGVEEDSKGPNCQHSRVDSPFAADIAVMLRLGVVMGFSWADARPIKPQGTTEDRMVGCEGLQVVPRRIKRKLGVSWA